MALCQLSRLTHHAPKPFGPFTAQRQRLYLARAILVFSCCLVGPRHPRGKRCADPGSGGSRATRRDALVGRLERAAGGLCWRRHTTHDGLRWSLGIPELKDVRACSVGLVFDVE